MAFTFGFSGDDIEHEDGEAETSMLEAAIDQCKIAGDEQLLSPKLHSLEDLLHDLPSQISYNLLAIPDGGQCPTFSIARRSVFDIRTQLMVEAVPEENDNDELLAGLDRGDLTSGVYEGGFKTWECALDLAALVADVEIEDGMHVIEIGAGSAIPSLTLLRKILRQVSENQPASVHLTLCDYNTDVLRLATAPNVFLAQQVSADASNTLTDHDMEIEEIDQAKVSSSCQYWRTNNTTFSFVSGGWGEDFVNTVSQSSPSRTLKPSKTLILASETIYSPKSTKVFTETLLTLLHQDPANTKAWVAAKVIYFGVGGGVQDFIQEVRHRNGNVKTILDVKGTGVGRVVLEVTAGSRSASSS